MSILIEVTPDELLDLRAAYNLELYGKQFDEIVQLYVEHKGGIILTAKGPSTEPRIATAIPYLNKPIQLFDKRVVSHDFADNTSWPALDNSEYVIAPSAGKMYFVTYIQVRFPKTIKLTADNTLNFSVNLYYPPAQAVVPVISLAYDSVTSIVRKSNTPVSVPFDIVDDLSTEKMVEIQFKYADPDNLFGSPIVLHDSLGESIKMWLSGHTPLKDTQGAALEDETWCVVNGKETYEF